MEASHEAPAHAPLFRPIADRRDHDRSPAAGLQFFGHIAIDGKTERMTVTLRDVNDAALWSTVIESQPV